MILNQALNLQHVLIKFVYHAYYVASSYFSNVLKFQVHQTYKLGLIMYNCNQTSLKKY
jgi:hypothetical protein